MDELGDLPQAVLDKLLAGRHPALEALRTQAAKAQVLSQELTGVGFFLLFEVPPEALRLQHTRDFELGDVEASISGLVHGAGFVLFIRDGTLDMLEGYSYDEPWPKTVKEFSLAYWIEPRELSFLDNRGKQESGT